MWIFLNSSEPFVALLAPVCSSFSACNVATSQRSHLNPWGDTGRASVRLGNLLMSRAILMACLVECLGGAYFIEQPGSSRIVLYPRFTWWVRQSQRLLEVGWWARSYGALTPKRHKGFGNVRSLGVLDKGKLTRERRESCIVKSTKRIEKDGKKQWSGNRHLKSTQPGPQPDDDNSQMEMFGGLEVLPHSFRALRAAVLAELRERVHAQTD